MEMKTKQNLFSGDDEATWKRRWKMMYASIAGYAMDGLDMLILSFVMTAIIKEFGLSFAEAGLIATYTLIGAVLGGYIFGIMADYVGRVKVFSLTIILFSIFTGLCAFASSLTELNIYRFLSGLGLGGEFGIGMTLVAETWPAAKRARASAGVAIGWQMGAVLAALLSALVVPHFGWRGLFAIGVLPALFAAWSRRGIPEPDIWVNRKIMKETIQQKVAQGEALTESEQEFLNKANKFPLTHLFANPRKSVTTFALTVMTSVQNFGYYGIMIWLPTILMQKHNLTLNKTTTWMVVTVIGMVIGIYLFGQFADRIGRRPAYITFYICSAAAVWGYSVLNDPILLLIGGAVLGFFCNGMMAGYGALLSEHYTTDARSTAQNFIFNSGRAVGGFAPVIIGMLAAQYTLNGALVILAFIYLAAAVNVFFLVPETKDSKLD
ncbi:MFS transporter [Sporomusa acidovorans]|uniref:Niacin/nicotinamide transporter NaiP n=1 Tax=Sporomusa acidovorans (strain ATCC 49682 / DSM 3132 / Mol) TaxID=1123286 RepID=A0ABZ3J5D7_SPOA4|nr:MFS transporter [Sporomusa acidovorans]OZC15388.1 putative niacin/nicotinamide transporter NaiP [Sporomusa acidovorans DSM 3132]SDF13616.1 benzoate transport [Sporomusa acidovorans]